MNAISRIRAAGPPRIRVQSGIALVLALWLTVLLTVLASGFAFSMRSEALATRNAVSLAQHRQRNPSFVLRHQLRAQHRIMSYASHSPPPGGSS